MVQRLHAPSAAPSERYYPFTPQNPVPVDPVALEIGAHIVLPIAPYETPGCDFNDAHHSSGFPSHSESFMDEERRVTRWARLQEGPRLWHSKLHDAYDGTLPPLDERGRFMELLLYRAGYIPEVALDCRGRTPQIVRLSSNLRHQLLRPGVLHEQRETAWRIGHYFGNYIVWHGMDAVRDAAIADQFMCSQNPRAAKHAGYQVLRMAAESVIDLVAPVYETARRHERIRSDAPRSALRFLMLHFGGHHEDYFAAMRSRLDSASAA